MRSKAEKFWHFLIGAFAVFGVICASAIVLTLIGIAHIIHGGLS
jgi:uncharacterized membrane-anchored protein YitT (DUF2179 family)